MSTSTNLDAILSIGTNAERLALTPTPPPGVVVIFAESDTEEVYWWNQDVSPAEWVPFGTGVGSPFSIDLAAEIAGTLPIANGGTGQTSKTPAFDALSPGTTKGDLIVHNGTDNVRLAVGTNGQIPYADSTQAAGIRWDEPPEGGGSPGSGGTGVIGIVIDGGGSVITTGVKGFVRVPVAATITKATVLSIDGSATSGSIVVDVWKDTYANFPPTDADSITAAAPPTLSAANKSEDSTLTGWSTSITAGDVLGFNVDSVATVTKVLVQLEVTT